MIKTNAPFTFPFVALLAILIGGCGGGGSSNNESIASNTYSTTSTRGDFAEWTLTGSALNATWQVINDTGLIDQTLSITATCGSPNVHGIRSCTIDTATCVDGVSMCSGVPTAGELFDLMDAPGVALFAITEAGTVDQQLHVGFSKDAGACADDLTGDYSFVHIGLSGNENFGLYRSDANFVNIRHVDFGFDELMMNASQTVAYRTGSEATILTDDGCTDGVRRRSAGSDNFRLMMTASGLFVLDFPSGQGGIVSFNVNNAATLADFAGKSFGGISFPDNGLPTPVSGVFGSVVGLQVNLTPTGGGALSVMDLGTATTMTANPAYPDFTITPAGYTAPPSVLIADFPTPDDIPGLFKMDGLTDSGRIVMAAMKFGTKVIAIGVVYNYRDTGDIDWREDGGMTNFTMPGLYNTGEFILFER